MILNYLLLLFVGWFHPLHVSISELELSAKSGSLHISHRIFIDDLEAAIKEKSGKRVDLSTQKEAALAQALVGEYIQQHFNLKIDGKPVKPAYLGYEVEDEAIWAYMEVPKVRKLSSITVHNSLFFNRFNDQTNLVNVKVGKELKSLRLEASTPQGSLSFK